jgi:hypothetical protein
MATDRNKSKMIRVLSSCIFGLTLLVAPAKPVNAQSAPAAQLSLSQQMAQALAAKSGGTAGHGGVPQGAAVPIPQTVGPKAPGRIRIGVAPVEAQVGQGSNSQSDYGTPIRNSIVLLMNGPAVEIVPLDAHMAFQVQAEAKQKECDYVLTSSVTVKHQSSGGFGKLMKMAGPAANFVPMLNMGTVLAAQAASMAATAAVQQQAANQLSVFNGQIKSKDDVSMDYQLYPVGGDKAKLQTSLSGKAKSDGEDVLTPLIEQAANTIFVEVGKK